MKHLVDFYYIITSVKLKYLCSEKETKLKSLFTIKSVLGIDVCWQKKLCLV